MEQAPITGFMTHQPEIPIFLTMDMIGENLKFTDVRIIIYSQLAKNENKTQ